MNWIYSDRKEDSRFGSKNHTCFFLDRMWKYLDRLSPTSFFYLPFFFIQFSLWAELFLGSSSLFYLSCLYSFLFQPSPLLGLCYTTFFFNSFYFLRCFVCFSSLAKTTETFTIFVFSFPSSWKDPKRARATPTGS